MKIFMHAHFKMFLAGVLLATILLLAIWRPRLLQEVDVRVYDYLLAQREEPPASVQVVVVDIDDDSLQQYGQWPWPRSLVALLLEQLRLAEPRAVGVDVLFAEADRNPQGALPEGLQARLGALLGADSSMAPDDVLALVLNRGPFVLGYKFKFSAGERSPVDPVALHPLKLLPRLSHPFQPESVLPPLDKLSRAASATGFLNALADRDGVFRRVPLVMRYQGRLYPSLALATLLQGDAAGLPGWVEAGGDRFLAWQGRLIPLDARGCLLLNFPKAKPLVARISAADILAQRDAAADLRGKVVFLGASAMGLDSRLTSALGDSFKGVYVHAWLAANLLQGDFLRIPAWAPGAEILLLLVVGLLFPLLLARIPPLAGVLVCLLSGTLLCLGSLWLLENRGLFLSPVLPLVQCVLMALLLILIHYRYQEEYAEEQHGQAAFMQNFMMQSLSSLTGIRDSETGSHILRTQKYLQILAEDLQHDSSFPEELSAETVALLFQLAALHDIGKVGVPDALLLKPGRLTAEEYEEIKKHTTYGRQVILEAEQRAGVFGTRMLQLAKDIVYCHHEWWNGAGYPEGLREREIPLAGRLMAVVDVYDALVSQRVYKPSISHKEAVRVIRARSGIQFDPAIVDGFLRVEEAWDRIHDHLSGSSTDSLGPVGQAQPAE